MGQDMLSCGPHWLELQRERNGASWYLDTKNYLAHAEVPSSVGF